MKREKGLEILGTYADREDRKKRNAAAYAEATAATMDSAAKLEVLRASWHVALESSRVAGEWYLTIRRRELNSFSGISEHRYRGTLSSVVARAHAGEKGD